MRLALRVRFQVQQVQRFVRLVLREHIQIQRVQPFVAPVIRVYPLLQVRVIALFI